MLAPTFSAEAVRIYVSYGLIYVHDADAGLVGLNWTEQHVLQGFARRSDNVNFACVAEDAWVDVALRSGTPTIEPWMRRVVSSSLFTRGRVCLATVDPRAEAEVEFPGPTWLRIALAQGEFEARDGRVRAQLYFSVENAERASEVILADSELRLDTPLVETAELARYE